ncbi:putative protein of unknown function (DUF2462) [Lyophyllum shimeji]|uniref:Uncharacterized protein n=1 Tax=Lyophyllum shimeji TaxID=47721 RepID=A0A9P3PN17_LYOSH|nr:putative protein of unknown function (DUF2462) [Lyophyllum shimeji]
MVQGKTKGLVNKTASSSRHAQKAAANPRKGQRYIAPKKPALLKQAAMKRDLTAKINKSIETQVVQAASSGKLTIMKNVGTDAPATKGKPKA